MALDLSRRLALLDSLAKYMLPTNNDWQEVCQRAFINNQWFTLEQISNASQSIVINYLDVTKINAWLSQYQLTTNPKTVGIVLAGNIPLVGFHDFLCGFLSGHTIKLKLSSKDEILLLYIIRLLGEWEPEVLEKIQVSERLNDCDAYIATGSNNSSRYFEQYFSHVPHIIRKNRTSVALLTGKETPDELQLLADDIFMYYGLGCRNVTQIQVPKDYDFVPLLQSFEKYSNLINHHKYKNNYDYHLAIYLLNRVPYMTNNMVLLVEQALPFSAVSVLHYTYYDDYNSAKTALENNIDIQAIVGHDALPFGSAQHPQLAEYADNVDTMKFLCSL